MLNKSRQDVWMYMKLDDSKAENKMSLYFMAFMNTLTSSGILCSVLPTESKKGV